LGVSTSNQLHYGRREILNRGAIVEDDLQGRMRNAKKQRSDAHFYPLTGLPLLAPMFSCRNDGDTHAGSIDPAES